MEQIHDISSSRFAIHLRYNKFSIIFNNTISNGGAGARLVSLYSTHNSTVDDNHIQNNHVDSQGWGIIIVASSQNNTITNNLILKSGCGIYITTSSKNNTIYLNHLLFNYENGVDLVIMSDWDNGTIGNYWSDYSGDDTTPQDGIGDTPHIIVGGQDNYPVVYPDSDGDGLDDYEEEHYYGTNATNADTDGDGYDDGIEISEGTDPLDPADHPSDSNGDGNGTPPPVGISFGWFYLVAAFGMMSYVIRFEYKKLRGL